MSQTPHTDPTESDPNADSREGLGGGMGVSSERQGAIRGKDTQVTYDSAPTHTDEGPELDEDGQPVPEQSSRDGRPEVNPDGVPSHPLDPDRNPGHGV